MNTLSPPVRGLLQLLRGSSLDPPLSESDQRALRELSDRTHCTLYWEDDEAAGGARIRNAERRRRLWAAYNEAAATLTAQGVEFVLLKGFTHEMDAGVDPARRYQSDLDFLCLPGDVARARSALMQAGYFEHGAAELSDNHARPLVKPFTWRWRGDHFDPDLPISIELHHTLWNFGLDRIRVPLPGEFWSRRTTLSIDGRTVPCLAESDRLAFAALHVLRHILRNNASPSHVFELACVLNRRAADREFWQTWIGRYDSQFRSLQAVAFQFAHAWFGCALSDTADRECRTLPDSVRTWFQQYAFSPLINLIEPNKDVVWLHLALLPRSIDRFAVGVRKLVPMHLPRREGAPDSYTMRLLRRSRYHAVALARTLLAGSRRHPPAASSTASQTSD